MRYSLAFHVVGIVLWLGGIMILTRFMKLAVLNNQNEALIKIIRRNFIGFVIPGMIIASLSGLYQLFSGGVGFYFKQGWFHGKVTLVLILFAVTALVGFELRRLALGQSSAKRITMLHGIGSLLLLLIVFLTFAGRP